MSFINIDIAKVAALGNAVAFSEDAVSLGRNDIYDSFGANYLVSHAWMREIFGVEFGLEIIRERPGDRAVYEVIGPKWSLVFDYHIVGVGPNPWRGGMAPTWAKGFPQSLVDSYQAEAADCIDFHGHFGRAKKAYFIGDYNGYVHDVAMSAMLGDYPGKIVIQAHRLRKKKDGILASYFGRRYHYA